MFWQCQLQLCVPLPFLLLLAAVPASARQRHLACQQRALAASPPALVYGGFRNAGEGHHTAWNTGEQPTLLVGGACPGGAGCRLTHNTDGLGAEVGFVPCMLPQGAAV